MRNTYLKRMDYFFPFFLLCMTLCMPAISYAAELPDANREKPLLKKNVLNSSTDDEVVDRAKDEEEDELENQLKSFLVSRDRLLAVFHAKKPQDADSRSTEAIHRLERSFSELHEVLKEFIFASKSSRLVIASCISFLDDIEADLPSGSLTLMKIELADNALVMLIRAVSKAVHTDLTSDQFAVFSDMIRR